MGTALRSGGVFRNVIGWPVEGADINDETLGPPCSRIIAIAAGGVQSVALTEDGTIISWGTWSYTDSPGVACPTGSGYKAISAKNGGMLAIKSDGSIVKWGDLSAIGGELYPPPAGTDFVAIAAGGNFGLALKADGSIAGWGTDANHEITDIPAGTDFVAIAAGESHGIALKSDGSLVGWGLNGDGQATCPAIEDGIKYTAIAAGMRHSLALKEDGSIVGWGTNGSGETTCPAGNSFIAVAAGAVSDGSGHSLALRSNGSVIGWGAGYGAAILPPVGEFNAIAVGGDYNLALKDNGANPDTLVGWGNPLSELIPLPVYNPDDMDPYIFTAISIGRNFGLALVTGETNSILAWGNDASDQVTDRPTGSDFAFVAAGNQHGVALKTDMHTIVCWGDNGSGQCDGIPSASMTYMAIAAGGMHSLVIHDLGSGYGSVIGWGDNSCGQCSPVPTANNDFAKITAGALHSVGLRVGGSIVCWGDNGSHQLDSPTGTGFAEIAAGRNHTIALKSDGTLVGWGSNNFGQTDCPSGNDYAAIAAGGNTSAAIKTDGSIAVWGWDGYNGGVYPAGNNFKAIAAGMEHCLAIKSIYTPKVTACDRELFAADATLNTITSYNRAYSAGSRVRVANVGGALPSPLAADTDYWVRDVSGNTCKLALTFGGAAIDITDAGTGIHYIRVRHKQRAIRIAKCIPSYAGSIDITFSGIIHKAGSLAWPSDPNRTFTVPKCAGDSYDDCQKTWCWGIPEWDLLEEHGGWWIFFTPGNHWTECIDSLREDVNRALICGQLRLCCTFDDGGTYRYGIAFETHSALKTYYSDQHPLSGNPTIDISMGRKSLMVGQGYPEDRISTKIRNNIRGTDTEAATSLYGEIVGYGGKAVIADCGLFADGPEFH